MKTNAQKLTEARQALYAAVNTLAEQADELKRTETTRAEALYAQIEVWKEAYEDLCDVEAEIENDEQQRDTIGADFLTPAYGTSAARTQECVS